MVPCIPLQSPSRTVDTSIVSDNNVTIHVIDERFGLAGIAQTCLQWILRVGRQWLASSAVSTGIRRNSFVNPIQLIVAEWQH